MFETLITTYSPVRGFLVQSSEDSFVEFFGEAVLNFASRHCFICTSRFSVDYANSLASFILEGTGEKRYCFVFFSVFSSDAAQILLKALEEPDEYTTVFLCTPYPYTVPLTIRSRVQLVFTDSKKTDSFVLGDRASMLEFIKKEFATEEGEAAERRAKAIEFLDTIEHHVREQKQKADVIYEAKKMLFLANMPTKFVLEYAVSMVL